MLKKINGVVHWDVESSPSGKEYAIQIWASYQQGIYYQVTPVERIILKGRPIHQVVTDWLNKNEITLKED